MGNPPEVGVCVFLALVLSYCGLHIWKVVLFVSVFIFKQIDHVFIDLRFSIHSLTFFSPLYIVLYMAEFQVMVEYHNIIEASFSCPEYFTEENYSIAEILLHDVLDSVLSFASSPVLFLSHFCSQISVLLLNDLKE